MPGPRKQLYVLDIDDVIRDGFVTQANAEALLRGINGSGSTVKLSVPYGGTNNGVFLDQQLLKYDAASGKLVSAGFTGVLPGGHSIFIPRETGTLYTDVGVDKTATSISEMALADHSLSLPINSQWSDLMVTFQFSLNDVHSSMTGLEVRLGDSPTPPTGFIQPGKTLLYQAGASPDNLSVTWLAMGQIPVAMAGDDLRVRLFGVPQDIPSYRTIITRASYRGLEPEPAPGGQKGVPVFLNTVVPIYSGTGDFDWATIDVSAYVPVTASAVILQSSAIVNGPDNSSLSGHQVLVRSNAGAAEFQLARYLAKGNSDHVSDASQGIFPFSVSGSTVSFQLKAADPGLPGVPIYGLIEVTLLGYLT